MGFTNSPLTGHVCHALLNVPHVPGMTRPPCVKAVLDQIFNIKVDAMPHVLIITGGQVRHGSVSTAQLHAKPVQELSSTNAKAVNLNFSMFMRMEMNA